MRTELGLLALLLMAGCGSDDGSGSSGGTAGASGQAGSGGTAGVGGTGGGAGGAAGQAGAGGSAGTGGNGCDADIMTDPQNCGACGHDCQGGACEDGACLPLTLADGLAYPYRIAVDDTDVYFTVVGTYESEHVQSFDGFVAMLPKSGGSLTQITQGDLSAWGLALDAQNVYAALVNSVNGPRLFMGEKGGELQDFTYGAALFIAHDAPTAVATASTVFFIDGNGVYAIAPGASRVELAMPETPPSGLAYGDGTLVFGDSGEVDMSDPDAPPIGNGTLNRMSAAGGAITVLDPTAGSPYAVEIDATHAYYTDLVGQRVVRVALDGSTVTEIASGQSDPYGVVVDDQYVYWTNRGGPYWERTTSCGGLGSVMRAPKEGGAAETLASGLDCAGWIAQDDNALYWIEQGSRPYESTLDGSVKKLAKGW